MEINIENEDLYALLDVESTCTTSDVKKAYRKKALQCHPDKNPDNPNAAQEFHKLTKVLEILTDESARKAYDRVLKSKKEAELRTKQLDSKRQKLKRDLEEREKNATNKHNEKSASEQLKDEIERLRREGSKQVQEEMDNIMQELKAECKLKNKIAEDNTKYRIKMKWQAKKNDPSNGGYTQENLSRFLSKYGDISVLVMSAKKNGSALVEFTTKRAAEMAFEIEKGLVENPLEFEWVTKPPNSKTHSTTIKESDYESIILTKMRQAEERKRLIEQMMAEDNDDT